MKKTYIIASLIILLCLISIIEISANVTNEDSGLGKGPLREDNKGWIGGKIIWEGHNLRNASIKVFKDQKLRQIYTEGLILDKEGIYALEIDDPGTYYLYVFVDDNGNNKPDKGDGMGIFGVADWSDVDQKPIPVKVEKGKKLLGIDIEITANINEQGQVVPVSIFGHSDFTNGISGKLILPDYKFKNAIVYVYSDPLWNNKITQTDANENGEFALEVPSGKYYLMAIIDENNSNLMDSGDKFGVYGMTRFGMYPKPIIVSSGKVIMERNILIIGKIDASGKPVPLQASDLPKTKPEDSLELIGKVEWLGHETKNAFIQAYTDPSMAVAVARAKADNNGNFSIKLEPGEYYLTVGVDADGDGKYSKGDGIGLYGTKDAINELPKKLLVTKDSQKEQIKLTITAQFDDSGRLFSIPQEEKQEDNAEQPIQVDTDSPFTGISGKIIWTDHKITNVILIFAEDPTFEKGVRVPLNLDENGVYACSASVGVHFLMAIVDNNENGQADDGDGIGFYGTGFLGDHWGTPHAVTVIENLTTPYINITITALLNEDGKPSMTTDGIKAYYGEPDNIFDTEENIQEWWYWEKGVSFTFNKNDNEWILVDVYEFEPKEMQSSNKRSNKGIIYYTFEDYIWSVNPDGTNRNRIASGINVTGTIDGQKILFLDSYTGLNMLYPYTQTLTQLDWKQTGTQQALSNDGKQVAFTREIADRKRITLMNIETGIEMTLPGENIDFSCPSWSSDGELIAYAGSLPLSKDQQGKPNRDIYYYDTVSGRTERVSDTPIDEFDPAWSSGKTKMLVFCRAESDHSQLWLFTFYVNG
ncbi:TPA: hypothetical protein ENS27_07370, partial [bacterium]|nr:hypothetical protein [bacterium]